MNVVVLHYHLNRGGVTRVIENHLAALDNALADGTARSGAQLDSIRAAIVFGGRDRGFQHSLLERLTRVDVALRPVEALDYDDALPAATAEQLARRLRGVLDELHFRPDDTLLHVHNHALGKNRALPGALGALAADGYPLLLQCHDFAEDFRPANYRRLRQWGLEGLYPQAPHIHYATLNGRDQGILSRAGVPDDRLHLLPNPAPAPGKLPDRAAARKQLAERFAVGPAERLLLYPVRGIRRKNVGEMLLYGCLAPSGTYTGITLPPINPREVPIYRHWKQLTERLQLNCRFDLGDTGGLKFLENLSACDAVLSTSLAEGFGMVFLEASLAGRPLVGRDLPDITADFVAAGVRYDWLRPALRVPLEWIGRQEFAEGFRTAYATALEAYQRRPPDNLQQVIAQKTAGDAVDFGDLDETMQTRVIERLVERSADHDKVLALNPGLEDALAMDIERAIGNIDHNAQAIARQFAPLPSGRRLLNLYDRVLGSARNTPPRNLESAGVILKSFLRPERFRPIRS